MDNIEKQAIIKELAKQGAFGVKKSVKLGGSHAIVIPTMWLKFHAIEIDGDYYFILDVHDGNLSIRAIDDADLENVKIKPKNEV